MTQRRFASWVEPIAEAQHAARAELAQVARSLPGDAWEQRSPNAEWTYKDLLAHMAGDTDKNVHRALRMVLAGRRVAPAIFEDIDGQNARDIEARRERSVEQLIAEIEADGEELEELLAQLKDEDENRRQPDIDATLGDALRSVSGHHARHLAELRTALGVGRETTSA